MNIEKVEPCPTQAGEMLAYEVEYMNSDTQDWKPVKTTKVMPGQGAPHSGIGKGVVSDIGLFTYEQAQAIAWSFMAHEVEYAKPWHATEVRIIPYRIVYSIKAWREEANAISLDRR